MEAVTNLMQSIFANSEDAAVFLKSVLILIAGALIVGLLARMLFGKKSVLNQSVSSAIGILFIYAATVLILSYGVNLSFLISPLPFVSISGEYMQIFSLTDADFVTICGQVLNMVILAFLVNLVNNWMPQGKHIFGWLFFRCVSVVLAMLLHVLVNGIFTSFLPEGFLTWAPVILLVLLIVMLLLGALKLVVGAALSTVNPLIGFLYTFFFASLVGKMLSKAVLTTLLLSCLVLALNHLGVAAVYIGTAALGAYVPLLLVLLVLWFLIGHIL